MSFFGVFSILIVVLPVVNVFAVLFSHNFNPSIFIIFLFLIAFLSGLVIVMYDIDKKKILITAFVVFTIFLFLLSCSFFNISLGGIIQYINSFKLNEDMIKILMLAGIVLIVLSNVILKNYKNRAKEIVLEKLLSYIGNFKFGSKYFENNMEDLHNIHLFDDFNEFDFDDMFTGQYKSLDVDITEIDLKKITGTGKNRREKQVFKGILIITPILKKYKSSCYTLVKPNSKLNLRYKDRIHLEDVEFEKYYDAYSNDQIEARYMLTTAFIQRMTQLAKKESGKNISICFEKGYVYIAVESNKDWFEIPILQPATKITNYRAIILEIITLLKIIDSLNLDKKTVI